MSVIDSLLDLIYPPRCMLCRRVLKDGEHDFCCKCESELGRFRNSEVRRDVKYVRLCVAPFNYKDELRASFHRYKFGSVTAYGRIYADFIAKSIDENQISCDIISWVPLDNKGLRRRGYDQSEIIARALADKLNIPCEKLLEKVRKTKRQSSLNDREARRKNVSGAYRCVVKEELLGKRVLIVDDIVTTGSTLGECALQLSRNGCNEIYAAAAATKI